MAPAPTETSSIGPLPTFLIIGAMKAGTTSLWRELRRHPDVFVPEAKEIQFFSDKRKFGTGLDAYRSLFADAGGRTAIGEASTGYTKFPRPEDVASRIATALPEVRLVYLVREPLARIRSHYLHSVHKGREVRTIDEAVRAAPAYLAVSRYRTQIDQYLAVFPRDRLLVITTEDLRSRRADTLSQVFAHIGVEPSAIGSEPVVDVHRSADKRLDTPLSGVVKRLPGYRLAADRAGATIKRRYRKIATTAVTDVVDTTLKPDTVAWIRAELDDEVAGLRPFLRDDWEGWDGWSESSRGAEPPLAP